MKKSRALLTGLAVGFMPPSAVAGYVTARWGDADTGPLMLGAAIWTTFAMIFAIYAWVRLDRQTT